MGTSMFPPPPGSRRPRPGPGPGPYGARPSAARPSAARPSGAWPSAARPFGAHRARHRAPADKVGQWFYPVAAVVVAALLVAGLLIRAADDDAERTRAGANAAPPTGAATGSAIRSGTLAAAHWAAANLPAGTAVLVPGSVETLLAQLEHAASCPPARYLVVDAPLRDRAAHDRGLARCLAASIPVADFGSGAQVRAVTTDRVAAEQARARSRADRTRGGSALAQNPAVQMSDALRQRLRAGALDLRAQALLAALASQHRLRLLAVIGEQGELAAGLPARTIEIAGPDRADIAAVLKVVAAEYRPAAVLPVAGGGQRIKWPFTMTAPQALD